MRYLLFENGDKLPTLGLGTWAAAQPGDVRRAVIDAIKAGYRHFDCAAVYGNESEIGEALSFAFTEGLVQRQDLWITSKLWSDGHGEENVRYHLDRTLNDLQLDYLDLYLIHWPVAVAHDYAKGNWIPRPGVIPLTETWKAMTQALNAGLTRHIGTSNFSITHLQEIIASGVKPEMNQIEVHPYLQQNELIAFCHHHGIHVTGFAPLGSSSRPAHLVQPDEPVLMNEPLVQQIAQNKGVSVAQVLIAWSLAKGISVIPKSANKQRIQQNFEAKEIVLEPSEKELLGELEKGIRYIDGSFWCENGSPITLEYLWS